MKLTKLQFKVLRVWLRYHSSGYGIGQWFRSCWKSWLLLGVMGAWSFYFVVPESAAVGYGFFGLCLGAFLRDIGYYQVSRRTWPVTERVIDWKQVQELVDSHDKPVA
jgi:hypothetical protein